jgi:protein-tyrosine-phosphatase
MILVRDDLVLVMEEWQRRQIVVAGSGRSDLEAGAVRLLGKFAPGRSDAGDEVADPMGGSDALYRSSAEHIRACVDGLVAWIEDERNARA